MRTHFRPSRAPSRLGRRVLHLAGAAALLAGTLAIGTTTAATAQTGTGDGQAPAGVGPNAFTVTPTTLDVMTGPDDSVAVTLDLDIYLPANATAATPQPAMLHTHGFGGAKDNAESVANATYFASKGYVVITHSTQGFGASTGCIGLDSTDYDAKNVGAIVDLLASMPEVATDGPGDPKVGLLGGSYGGGLQGGAAFLDPRIDAIAPGRTWNALQYSLVPNNWVIDPATDLFDLMAHEQGVFKQTWTSLFFASGASRGAPGGSCDPINQQLAYPGALPCPGFVPEICPIYASLTTTGNSLDGQRDVIFKTSIEQYIDELTVPTLVVQGLPDTLFTPTEATATYTALRDRGVPAAMIWISSGHGGYFSVPGEAEAYTGQFADDPEGFANSYLPRRTLQWFEKHVRGVEVDTGPAFAWFRDWVEYDVAATGGTAAPAYGTATDYPAIEPTTLFVDGASGNLRANAADVTEGSLSFLNPAGGLPAAYTETPNFSGPGASPNLAGPVTEIPTQNIVLSTAPAEEDLEFTGIPTATLNLSSANPAADIRFFAKIYEVDAAGGRTLLRRQVAASRIPVSAAAEGPVTVLLPPVADRIEAGHRIEVVLAATDLAYYNERLPNQIVVSSSPDNPSVLSLPLRSLSAPVVAPPAPPPPLPTNGPDDDPAPLPVTGGGLALVGLAALASSRLLGRTRD